MNTLKLLSALLVFSSTQLAHADTLSDATRELCNSVKSCALEQIAEQDLTPEMRQMMEPMMENMCATMNSKIRDVPTSHELYQPAVDCINSMQSLSCAQMQDPAQSQTTECRRYEELTQ